MTVRIADAASVQQIVRDLADARGSNGLVRLTVQTAEGGEAMIVIGRDFALDGELASRIEHIAGEGSVDLSVQEPPRLALVG